MPKSGKIFTLLLNAAIFIAMEVAALNMLSRANSVQNFFLSKAAHVFMGKVWGATQDARYYFSLVGANEDLSKENFALRQALLQYVSSEELDSLARSLSSASEIETGQFIYKRGTIVKMGKGTQHNYIIIGQGSEDGVKPQTGIITPQGIIGIVDAVGRHYSYAMSFMNSEFQVSARLGREGTVGPMVWDGKSTSGALLKEIPLQYRFQPGDTVFSSGYSSIFPSDIPLGLVGDSRVVNGATYEISVRLLQDFGALRYVTLVENIGSEEIEELETLAEPPQKKEKKQSED